MDIQKIQNFDIRGLLEFGDNTLPVDVAPSYFIYAKNTLVEADGENYLTEIKFYGNIIIGPNNRVIYLSNLDEVRIKNLKCL